MSLPNDPIAGTPGSTPSPVSGDPASPPAADVAPAASPAVAPVEPVAVSPVEPVAPVAVAPAAVAESARRTESRKAMAVADVVVEPRASEGGSGPSSPGMHASARMRRTASGRLTTASGKLVATLPPLNEPGLGAREAEEPPGQGIGAWLRQNPGLALVLLAITFVGPYVVNGWRTRVLREQLTASLDGWQARLEAQGLPAPWIPPVEVAAPPELPTIPGPFNALGLGQRHRALLGWQALRAGREPQDLVEPAPALEPGVTARVADDAAWYEAVRACALLRKAARSVEGGGPLDTGALDAATQAASRAPVRVRQLLDLDARVLAGRSSEVTGQATHLLMEGPPPITKPGLEALLTEARRARAAQVLSAPDVSQSDLREVTIFASDGLPLGELLARRLPAIVETLAPDAPGSVLRATALVDLVLAAERTGATPPAPVDLAAWRAERMTPGAAPSTLVAGSKLTPVVASVIGARIGAFDSAEVAPAFALLDRLSRLDETADVPAAAFTGWREHLQGVVNQPERLQWLALRFFELGWVPPGIEALFVSSYPLADGSSPRPLRTPGERLGDLLVRVAALERPDARERPDAHDDVAATVAALDDADRALIGRRDPVARRLAAQHALLLARALRATLGPDRAALQEGAARIEAALDRAQDLGHEPLARVHHERALLAAALRRGGAESKVEAAQACEARSKLLDELAARLEAGLEPGDVVAWQLRGWPAERRELAVARSASRLEQARVFLADGKGEVALELATNAATLHPDVAAPAHLARAEALLALGRKDDARAACDAGLAALVPGQARVREQLMELRTSIGD